MLCVVIVLGFLMLTIGVALLLVGETPFLGGKRIPALRARLIGTVLVSYLPLALGVRQATNAIIGDDAIHGFVVTGVLFVLCWLAVLALMFRVMFPKRAPRPAAKTAAKPNPFEETPLKIELVEDEAPPVTAPAPAKKPVAKKSGKPPVEEKNPLDFS